MTDGTGVVPEEVALPEREREVAGGADCGVREPLLAE